MSSRWLSAPASPDRTEPAVTSDLHREARAWLDAYEQGMAFDAAAPRIVRDLLAENEQLDTIRLNVRALGYQMIDGFGVERDELQSALDAVTRERDEAYAANQQIAAERDTWEQRARRAADDLIHRMLEAERERDEARATLDRIRARTTIAILAAFDQETP